MIIERIKNHIRNLIIHFDLITIQSWNISITIVCPNFIDFLCAITALLVLQSLGKRLDILMMRLWESHHLIDIETILFTLRKYAAVGWEGATSNDRSVWKYSERHSSTNSRTWNLRPLPRTTKRSARETHYRYVSCPSNWQDFHNARPRMPPGLVKETYKKFLSYISRSPSILWVDFLSGSLERLV